MSITVALCPVGGPALRATRRPPEPMTTLTTAWMLAAIGFAAVVACCLELRRRRELVARACHELRGPLTAVRLSLATMERRGEAPPERLASLELELRRAGLALDDFAAARSGRRTTDRHDAVEIAELLEEQLASWQVVAAAFQSTLWLGSELPGAFVGGDRLRLAQAISNLVANALEHAPGRVELAARRVGARHVRIEVIDEGPGLPLPVGALTRRARAGRGRRGRGLAIAVEIADRHGGRIVATSAPQGARIGIELPLVRRPG
ncbi:MAG: two-component system, OmpR family, sensor kinase [Solirubrobacteraceae bacterium]|nr:two-component system, OmpR family, sensor kinase [Solirubrobacteraceae bacterium]